MGESETQLQLLPVDADQALFTNQVRGLAVVLHRNERPLGGLAGLLDWRFHGQVSAFLRAGAISGENGQCAYIPITRHGITYHLLFVGAGDCPAPGKRNIPTEEWLSLVKRNVASLKVDKIGLSRSDLGGISDEFLRKNLKGLQLWIVQ